MSDAVAVHLAREVLRRGRPFRDRTRGGSMRPLVPAGSEIEVEPCAPRSLHPGDVVLVALPRAAEGPEAELPARLVAHRLLVAPGARGRTARTKGDRSPHPDPPVSPDDVLGLVVAVTPRDGVRRDLRTPTARTVGLLLALLSPWLGLLEAVFRSTRRSPRR